MIVQKELFGEGKHVEFKAEIPKKHEKFLKDIIAFANTSGGKTIIGIEDETGEVLGLGEQNPFKLSDAISNMISDACIPQIYTEITAETIADKTILNVEVFPGTNRPYYLKSAGKERSAYIRINGTSRPAGEFILKELELEGARRSYDMLWEIGEFFDENATTSLMESMYQTALREYKGADVQNAVRRLSVEKLEDFGILLRKEGKLVPSRAFTLLTKPRERYIKIQCALFKGTKKVDFIDRKEFRGPVQEQIEQAHQFVLRHTNKGAVIEGLYRQDVYELPVSSIREIITNAVLHRSYVDPASIQVSIYDDRIEIDSPGMLCAGLSVADALSGKSKCRNKALAEAFQYMNLIEGWGTGLPRLFESCAEMGLPEPKFEEFGDGIKVTIYRAIGDRPFGIDEANKANTDTGIIGKTISNGGEVGGNGGKSGGDGGGTGGKQNARKSAVTLSENEKKILSIIFENEHCTSLEISAKTGIARRTVERSLRNLKQEGVLERVGSPRSGHWKILEGKERRRCDEEF